MPSEWHGTILEEATASSQRIAPRTRDMYLRRVQSFIKFAGASPHAWTPITVEKWRDSMLASGLQPKTANLYISALQFAAKRMERLGKGADFVRAAERARVDLVTEPPDSLTRAQCSRLLQSIGSGSPPDIRDKALILVALHCAFRRAELCSISFDEIRGRRIRVIAKGRRVHTVTCSNEAWEALQAWVAWLRKRGISSGPVFRSLRSSIDDDPWIVGDGLTPDGFAYILRERGAAANVKDLRPHRLRHTYASLALEAGIPSWKIKQVLGHKTDTMLQRYSHDLDPQGTAEGLGNLTDDEGNQ